MPARGIGGGTHVAMPERMRIRDVCFACALALVPPPSCGETTEAPSSSTVKKEQAPPPPGYKGTNEGAQGRVNATDDHARAGESPTNERRP